MQTIDKPDSPSPGDALLLIATGCAHCQSVLAGLAGLIKQGVIGRLEVINIAVHPGAAATVGTRTVPWLRIGAFELEGAQSPSDLALWAGRAASGTGHAPYLRVLLESRQLARATRLALADDAFLRALLELVSDLDTPMGVRIGVGAVIEELAAQGRLAPLVEGLEGLARSESVQLRADAAHYLGLSGAVGARNRLEALLSDRDQQVREIAADSLAMLDGNHAAPPG